MSANANGNGTTVTPPAGAGASTETPKTGDGATPTPPKPEGSSNATPEGSKGSEQKPDANAGTKPPEAPAEVSITVPEGMEANAAFLDAFKAKAKELGIKSEGAQALFDTYVEKGIKAQAAALKEEREGWVNELKGDKVFGGEKYAPMKAEVVKFLTDRGHKELAEAVNTSALGDLPMLFRAFADFATASREDRLGGRGAEPKPPDSDKAKLDRMFPSMK